jgi:hypothetical protein
MALGNQTSSSEYVPEIVESQQYEDVSFLSGNLQIGGRQLLIPGRRIYWKVAYPSGNNVHYWNRFCFRPSLFAQDLWWQRSRKHLRARMGHSR